MLCHIDDVVIFGHTKEEHDARLEIALRCIEAAGVTLNPTKCQFEKTEIKFLGHLISEKGIQPDPDKTAAIAKMPRPTCVQELKRFMGIVNHLSKFSRNLAELSQPLRALLSKNNLWTWDSAQDQAFARIKEEITKPTVLVLYDVKADTKISADTSSYILPGGSFTTEEQPVVATRHICLSYNDQYRMQVCASGKRGPRINLGMREIC